jgi:hypothetical protein
MAYQGKGKGKRLAQGAGRKLGEDVFVGRAPDLDDAIRAAVGAIPASALRRKKTYVVTSITVDVVGDPDVGSYGVTIM